MKKILLLLLVLLMFTTCGCKKEEKEEKVSEQRKNVVEKDSETGEEYYLLADFENYYECSQVGYNAAFGKVTQITKKDEPDMVPYGNQSVKLEILGTEETWRYRRPNMRFHTKTGFFNKTTDFTNMSRITFDIYNTQDYEASIRFYIDYGFGDQWSQNVALQHNTDYIYSFSKIIDLKPNSWNHVEILAEEISYTKLDEQGKEYLAYGADVLEGVGAFVIEFDRGEIHEEQEVFYFDNLRAYLKNKE